MTMTILEFLRTSKPDFITFLFITLTRYCECGVGECPYALTGGIKDCDASFPCLDDKEIEKWLNSECSEWLLEQMKIDITDEIPDLPIPDELPF